MKKRTYGVVAATALAVLALAGCGGQAATPAPESTVAPESTRLDERTIKLRDGRTLTCVIYHSGYAGGLSCDWEGLAAQKGE